MDASDHESNAYSAGPNGVHVSTRSEMQKVRDLLFGEQQRAMEQRLLLLEQRLSDFQRSTAAQLTDISRRVDALAAAGPAQQRDAMLALSRAVAGLGQDIAHLALDGAGAPPDASKSE